MQGRLLAVRQVRVLVDRVLRAERRFFQPGVAYDAETGLTFDGHPVDPTSGELIGTPRNWSAASKESLHLILLAKAIAGDEVARAVLSPDPDDPSRAVDRALDVLARKIASYATFDRAHPGYGGFLPWFTIAGGRMVPKPDWAGRVPALDNGQLAWSIYLTERTLRQHGHERLADQYAAHLGLMRANVVRVFYDGPERHFRGETVLGRGNLVEPARNRYHNVERGYLLDDAHEGLMLLHFADLFGDWTGQPGGRDAVWRQPRRQPAWFRVGERAVTVVRGCWFSSHEEWGHLVLPFRDVPVADRLFVNGQRVRTQFAAERGFSGLFASTHRPVRHSDEPLEYEPDWGIEEVATDPIRAGAPVFTPYAAFPLALVDQRLFVSWLSSMVDRPGMLGRYGVGESYAEDGRVAPILTWDGKALTLIALMGGVSDEIRRGLVEDGHYEPFLQRVRADYRLFEARPIEGEDVPLRAPTLIP